MKKLLFCLFLVISLCSCSTHEKPPISDNETQILNAWNKQILTIAEDQDGFLTLKGVRAAAMMHIAMHDAINAIENKFEPYVYENSHPNADANSVAIYAAYFVAIDQYPKHFNEFERLKNQGVASLQQSSDSQSKMIGKAAAQAILSKRKNDNWNEDAEYTWHPMAPGVYAEFSQHSGTPQGFIFGAGWAKATPFALKSHDQFRSPPPPKINSAEYTLAFNEVKNVGAQFSQIRTDDQTHLALWWKDFAENSHNRLARQLVTEKSLGIYKAARLFALLNLSIFDAYINVFDNKFHFNHWRPYTAIRWADKDGNSETTIDKNWTNTHGHTYAFPSYPSAHGTACSSAMTVFADVFGDQTQFSMSTPSVDKAGPFSGKLDMEPKNRYFRRFSEAAMECSLSRIFLGIHFRYDSIEGNRLGKKVGDHVVKNFLKPVNSQT